MAYNGASLPVTGVLNNWQKENSFTFQSCDHCNPGELVIKGYDYNSWNNCVWGGLILHCTAVDTSSPWHNFVSDTIHWKVGDGSIPCTNNGGMIPHAAGANINFIADLLAAGAKKIWSNTKQVALIGGPEPDCDCKRDEDCPDKLQCCIRNGQNVGVCEKDCPCFCQKDEHCQKGKKCCDNECKDPQDCDDIIIAPNKCRKHEDCPTNLKCCDNVCKNPWECKWIPDDNDKIKVLG